MMENNIPTHIAIIMDGNGRWAESRGDSRISGHKKGVSVAKNIVTYSSEIGVQYLTLYTFSKENWNRPAYEVNMLMGFIEKHLTKEGGGLKENNIRFRMIGNVDDLPAKARRAVKNVEELTKDCTGMLLQLAISYSGRDEIVMAAKKIAERVVNGEMDIEDINEESLSASLYTSGVPDPDLLIRTSGESRISNFLLWQLAYTELYVTDILWPDFTSEDLIRAIEDYASRQRRFGLTGGQLVGVAG